MVLAKGHIQEQSLKIKVVPTLRFDYYEIPRSSFSFSELVKFGIPPKQKRIIEKMSQIYPIKIIQY